MSGSRHPRDPAPASFQTSTTSPQTRKRKAIETFEESSHNRKQNKVKRGAENTPSTAALNTPPLTTMDSDDEFMSGLSSQDEGFGEAQESDDGSLGDGTYEYLVGHLNLHIRSQRLTSNVDHRI